MVKKKVIFTTKELMERYGKVLRTIQHWQRTKGYPLGDLIAKEYHFSYEKVIAWEKIHMPHLHPETIVDDETEEQSAQWQASKQEREREKESPTTQKKKKPRPRKPK